MSALLRPPLPSPGVYAITPLDWPTNHLLDAVEESLQAGVRWLQYRRKKRATLSEARAVQQLCARYNVTYIINDDAELACKLNAGLHVGADDTGLQPAREQLPNSFIGVSCYNRLARARTASAEGCDYVAFGAFYASGTKPNAVRADVQKLIAAQQQASLAPIVAIGGITTENAQPLIEAGARWCAMIGGLWNHRDGIYAAVDRLHSLYDENYVEPVDK